MFKIIKNLGHRFICSRIAIVSAVLILFSLILLSRIYYLQILHGDEYLEDYTMSILKEKEIAATRGTIYDRNGNVLAYDELSYDVDFEDTGEYTTDAEMNSKVFDIIEIVEKNDDELETSLYLEIDEDGNLEYTVKGTSLNRFKADVYGKSSIDDLGYNTKLGYDESSATADQIFKYLCDKYSIYLTSYKDSYSLKDESSVTFYSDEDALKIINVRYAMSANAYQKYIETTIASNVSEETVAMIEENSDQIIGVEINESTVRVYNNSKYFAHIIGYTGTISEDEYEELSEIRDDYSLTDMVGKSGIEEYMETTLQGTKGSTELYVDNVGTVIDVASVTDSVAGNDVYLTIDMDLQIAVYDLLEQELASILYSKISNINSFDASSVSSSSDIVIPITDVYFALINNNVIDIEAFADEDAGETEQKVYKAYQTAEASVIKRITNQLTTSDATIYNDLSDEMQDYENYIMSYLYDESIVDKSAIDTASDEYTAWKDGESSLKEYLEYLISCNNIDTSQITLDEKYADMTELYDALVSYIEEMLTTETDFHKVIYEYMIYDGDLTGTQVCLILYEQGILTDSGSDVENLKSGSVSAYSFIKSKIKNLEITPAQLALDPCNASSVVVDPNTGEVLACVTYPGYDNNKLANSVDATYYASLTNDLSYPLLNYATQQKTAPGSTFKPITATAALTEGFITAGETIKDLGIFTKVSLSPKCWIYPSSTHGSINVSEALRDSCNYFFYECGYRMATSEGSYDDDVGLSILSKYATMYGLSETTGIEIPESEPEISDSDAVRSAIGQGTNNFTTSQLARYVATVANSGTCYNLSLISKTTDSEGNVLSEFTSEVYNTLDSVSDSTWTAIHYGMKLVVENLDSFDDIEIEVAGKTGTAQEKTTRANHALFVCYAPYDDPTVAIATRIPYGYSSGNAAEVTSHIIEYFFELSDLDSISESIQDSGGSSTVTD
ncbi:MAG: peptidoglycan glycosyltransferase [Eubacterium sp.]|nr:peptidoglycan glycosyltransferase [Eubacterium sp.]